MPRDLAYLACGICNRRTYSTTKNRRLQPERIEQKRYCRFCRKHTVHKETR